MTLREAYRRTTYRAGDLAVRPGFHSRDGDAWLASLPAREAAFITAWNPMSRRHAPGWNARQQERLRAWLRRYPTLEGMSGFNAWQEHNLLVAADTRLLIRAAQRFRQAAILVLRRSQPARLLYKYR
ncbi:MAG: DUF3293 domain-containing protein [Roseococcus sp.]